MLTVWECALRGPGRYSVSELLMHCEAFVQNPEFVETSLQYIPPPVRQVGSQCPLRGGRRHTASLIDGNTKSTP